MRFVLLVTATAALALGCAKPQAPAQGAQPAEAPKSQMDLIAQDVLTPGGIYTQADIDANGNISPFEKYADVMNDPNMAHTPAGPGDYACPITGSKGAIDWQIAGKKYLYCCVPCILDHVRKAKKLTDPAELPAPETFLVTGAPTPPAEH